MEKRRRARINQSLTALKALILDTAKADNTKHSKLEKADILELTVRHFQRHRSLDTEGVHQYKAGFVDCVREVQRYLDTPDAHTMTVLEAGVKQRLVRHLESCVAEVDADLRQQDAKPAVEDRLQHAESSNDEEVNNNRQEAVQKSPLVPQTLPTKVLKSYDGNLVFLLPSHYLQLASALGINLRPQVSTPSSSNSPDNSQLQNHANSDEYKHADFAEERPLDFSSNDIRDNMWRPW